MAPPYSPWPGQHAAWTLLDAAQRPLPTTVPAQLEPGDVRLSCPGVLSWQQSAIARAQHFGHGMPDACFTHVALYTGAGQVHDATPQTQVSSRALAVAQGDGWLRARRLLGLQPHEQRAICAEAAQMVGRYSVVRAAVHGLLATAEPVLPADWQNALSELIDAFSGRHDQAFYCSEMVRRAHALALGHGAQHAGMIAPLPATFSASPLFDAVSIAW